MDRLAPRPGRAPGRLQAHVITAMSSSADEREMADVGCQIAWAGMPAQVIQVAVTHP